MRLATILVALVLGAAGAGCQDSGGPSGEAVHQYVAMGDSYTSGAGLADSGTDASGCPRSRLAYPALVAKKLGATLQDASCGGATTRDAASPQATGDGRLNPPQLSRVTSSTDLVTVGLGYNDSGWFFGLLMGCPSLAAGDPDGHPCEDSQAGRPPEEVARSIGASVETTLREVHAKSPDARVLLIGYPQPVPAEGTCPELPLATGDYPFVRSAFEQLDTELQKAAEDADATYVDVMTASAGHDICAGPDAWVNGAIPRQGVAASYHPFADEQRAVATLILRDVA